MRRTLLILLVLLIAVPVFADVAAARATVAATATEIYTNTTGSVVWLALVNQCASASVYVGGSTVATTTGLELAPTASLSLRLAPGEAVYGIVATSTCRVDYIRSGG